MAENGLKVKFPDLLRDAFTRVTESDHANVHADEGGDADIYKVQREFIDLILEFVLASSVDREACEASREISIYELRTCLQSAIYSLFCSPHPNNVETGVELTMVKGKQAPATMEAKEATDMINKSFLPAYRNREK